MKQTAEIIEVDAERDRKICVSLDLKVIGANRELAQWLIEHSYSNREVAGWLGCRPQSRAAFTKMGKRRLRRHRI